MMKQLKELGEPKVTYQDFVNHKLIQFSQDNIRSLPNVLDGLSLLIVKYYFVLKN